MKPRRPLYWTPVTDIMERMKRKGLFTRLRGVGGLKSGLVATAMVLVMHWTAADAWAQRSTGLGDDEGVILRWAIAAGVVVIIGLPAFLNPKRSHLT